VDISTLSNTCSAPASVFGGVLYGSGRARIQPCRHEGHWRLVVGGRHTKGRHQGLHTGSISVGSSQQVGVVWRERRLYCDELGGV
jgi:hypothetical protein